MTPMIFCYTLTSAPCSAIITEASAYSRSEQIYRFPARHYTEDERLGTLSLDRMSPSNPSTQGTL